MKIYNLFFMASADTNAAAQVMIMGNGTITAIDMTCNFDSIVDSSRAQVELSFASTFLGETNDAVGPIANMYGGVGFATSGLTNTANQKFIGGIMIPVKTGNILYAHLGDLNGTIVAYFHATVYVR
jgi:hypothetical protein